MHKNNYLKNCETGSIRFKPDVHILILLLVTLLMVRSVPSFSQGRSITGTVVSAEDSGPIPGAVVQIKGTSKVVSTNANGQYTIAANTGDILVFKYLGFRNQEVTIAAGNTINVVLQNDITGLDEVVVVGYGTVKKGDLTGAVTSISSESINKSLNTTVEQALQGRAAGVEVTQNSGTPGGGITVNIRGISTIGGSNQPLYIIDGIQVEGSNTSVISAINPSDIESIEVLKDASSSAIYGSRASNGVILITTKKGMSGVTRISYDGYYGSQELPVELEVMNLREYAAYSNVRSAMLGFGEREEFASPEFLGEGTNWQRELFQSAPMQNHNISLSGGNDRTKFAVSAGYFDQNGIAIGSEFNRFNIKVNVEDQSTRWLKVGANVIASRTNQKITVTESNLVYLALQQRPDIVARNPDGSWGFPTEENFGNYTTNIIAEALSKENSRKRSQMLGSLYGDINIIKGLTNHTEISTNVGYSNAYVFNPSLDLGEFISSSESSGNRSADNSLDWQFRNYLTYNHVFAKKHNLTAMVGYEAQESSWESLFGARTGFFTNNIHELPIGDAETATNSSSKGSNAMQSVFSRLNYAFDDRYLLTATIRRDASSRFGENNQWGTFPSFAAAWKVSNEQFFKNLGINAVDNFKLRFGYGEVGNQGWQNYGYGVALNNVRTVWGTGAIPGNIGNPDLKWETTKASNLGLDISLFKNRVQFVADAYNKRTKGLLLNLPLPSYAGTTGAGAVMPPLVNLGDMQNKGLEFTLNTLNINTKSFSWNTTLMYSLNRNKVLSLVNEDAIILAGRVSQTMVGEQIGLMYGYVVDGMFNTADDFYQKDGRGNFILGSNGERLKVALPAEVNGVIAPNSVWLGDYRFKDLNNDGVIDEKDRQVIGNPQPKFQYGMTNTFTFKGFDLSVFLQGVYGNDIYNTLRVSFENPANLQGLLKTTNDYAKLRVIDPNMTIDPADGSTKAADQILSNVQVSNAGTMIPRMTTSTLNENYRNSTRFVENGSYLRIKNVTLGYNLPQSFLGKTGLKNLRVYANIQNLYTFSKYSGYDPEVGGASALDFGTDYGRYPTPRIYTFGLNLSLQ